MKLHFVINWTCQIYAVIVRKQTSHSRTTHEVTSWFFFSYYFFLAPRIDNAIHFQAPTELQRTKQEGSRKNAQAPRLNSAAIKSSRSAFVSARPGHRHNPFSNSQTARMRRKRELNHAGPRGQLVPVSQRRTIVINRAHDAPDPFCILTRTK